MTADNRTPFLDDGVESEFARYMAEHPRQWGKPYVQDNRDRRERMTRFLKMYEATNRVTHSCRYAGISKSTYRDWVARDPLFAEEVEEAKEAYRDELMLELKKRAVLGVRKYKGQTKDGDPIYDWETSDRLFELELKRVEPGFRDRVDVTSGDQAIAGVLVVPPKVTLEQFVEEAEKLRQEFQAKGYM